MLEAAWQGSRLFRLDQGQFLSLSYLRIKSYGKEQEVSFLTWFILQSQSSNLQSLVHHVSYQRAVSYIDFSPPLLSFIYIVGDSLYGGLQTAAPHRVSLTLLVSEQLRVVCRKSRLL